MRRVATSSLITPAGGGGFTLPATTIGIFRSTQPAHRLSVGTDRATPLPLAAGEGWIMPAGAEGLCLYDAPLDALIVSVPDALLREAGLDRPGAFAPMAGRLDPLTLQLALAMPEAEGHGALYAESLSLALAARLAAVAAPAPPVIARIGDARLRRALAYIHDNLGAALSVEAMAREAAMSPAQFTRAFRAATGTSPLQYVIAERMAQAQALLRGTRRSVAEIAHEVGYDDVSRFGRHFRRATGATPAAFRAG